VDILHCVSIKRVELYLIAAQTITLHSSYFEWPKYMTAKQLLYTVYRGDTYIYLYTNTVE